MASRVGTFTGPGSATTQNITGLPFEPGIDIVVSALSTANDTSQSDAFFGIGAAVSSAERATALAYCRNGLTTSQTAEVFQSNNFFSSVDNSDAAVEVFDLTSQNSDGFSVTWDIAATYLVPYLSLPDTVSAKVGFFDLNTAPGSQSVAGVGFEPGLVLFFTATPNTTEGGQAQAYWSFGAGDAEGGVFSLAAREVDAVSRTDAARYMTESFAFTEISTTAVTAQFSTVTMTTDGFDLNITTAPAVSIRIGYIALGGPNFRAKIGAFTEPGSLGGVSYSFPGFQPDSLILAYNGMPAGSVGTVVANFAAGMGFADASANQASACASSLDNRDPQTTFARRRTSNAACINQQNVGLSTSVVSKAALTAMTSTGYTLDWTVSPAATYRYQAIAISTEAAIEPGELSLTGQDVTLEVAGNVTIVLDVASNLALASGADLSLLITLGDGGIEPGELALAGASDITFTQTFNVTLTIEPAMLSLDGAGVSGLNCQCLDVSTSYQFGSGTQIVDIITEAYERCGIDGTLISGTMLDSARRSLEYLFVDWANNGPNLFLTYLYTVTLVPGTQSYTLPDNTIYIVNAATRQTNGSTVTDLMIGPISRAEYLALPQKAQTASRPTQFYLERSRVPVIYPWPVLQTGGACQLLLYLLRATSDIEKFCGAIDGPQRIMNAAAAGLAAKLATKYAWERREALKEEYQEAYGLMTGEDRERVPYRVTIDNPWGP